MADHLSRVRDQVQSFDELLGSILQAGLARITVAENLMATVCGILYRGFKRNGWL